MPLSISNSIRVGVLVLERPPPLRLLPPLCGDDPFDLSALVNASAILVKSCCTNSKISSDKGELFNIPYRLLSADEGSIKK